MQNFLSNGPLTEFEYADDQRAGRPDLPAGSIVFIEGMQHVVLATGTMTEDGLHEVMSHWEHSWLSGHVKGAGRFQRTTLERVLEELECREARFGPPSC